MAVTLSAKQLAVGAIVAVGLVGATILGTSAAMNRGTEPVVAAPAASSAPSSASAAPSLEAPRENFENAVAFTRASHESDYAKARSFASPDSDAGRYLDHMENVTKAYKVSGNEVGQDEFAVEPSKDSKSIVVDDGETSYTWKDFTYDSKGQVTSWTGASGKVGDVLWSKGDEDTAMDTTVTLVSAYRANSGAMFVVAEVSAKRSVNLDLFGATYTADGDYKQKAYDASSVSDLRKGEKTLVYLVFNDADFGGTVKLAVNTPDYTKTGTIKLTVK